MFTCDRWLKSDKASDIAARLRDTCDEATADRVADDDEYNRNCLGSLEKSCNNRGAVADNDIRMKADQLFRKTNHTFSIACSESILDA